MARLILVVLIPIALSGCYYVQAAKGQWELTRKREPIADVIASEDTAPELARRLQLVEEARRFAIDVLGLPDNDTYRSYADIERDYVVWNVFAAPEFSLQPKTWCFPVAGCVSYRGYFHEEDAERAAKRLAAKGYDVAVGGVAAYSTLGKLNDPVLSSMMHWDDVQLVAVLFHELAHQVLYVKGDTGFNESFATAVEEFGVQRWLAARGLQQQYAEYMKRRELSQQINAMVDETRSELESVYASPLDTKEKREQKSALLASLQQRIAAHLQQAGRDPSPWLQGELNNARLVPMALYEARLPEFRQLYEACKQSFDCFYAAARELARR
jgi:predicted aminopeptidase